MLSFCETLQMQGKDNSRKYFDLQSLITKNFKVRRDNIIDKKLWIKKPKNSVVRLFCGKEAYMLNFDVEKSSSLQRGRRMMMSKYKTTLEQERRRMTFMYKDYPIFQQS